ncbi:MAG: septum site-determining protein MinC [Aphanothece sp. CMT-3BRIN-NPC111]|jgi:septum site-determining protein MinC|nr:septum site-determining protein MinC [Aphanothece sp. CMT-3BRIN-NPC111]
MTSDAALPTPLPDVSESVPEENRNLQVQLKSEEGTLLLILPTEAETHATISWTDLWEQLKHRLNAGDRFWPPQVGVHLMAQDRLLDGRQLKAIADALNEAQMQLKRVYTNRRQTAVAAATAGYSVEQQAPFSSLSSEPSKPASALADPLYLETTVRSGIEIRHSGTVVVMGDVNPGGSVVAAGDILVWGRLRGIAHAGAFGNSQCRIMALQMEPTQLRIADYMARAPETPLAQLYPEVAYVTPSGIRIARATDFSKTHLFSNS